jgi:hypothetical protein
VSEPQTMSAPTQASELGEGYLAELLGRDRYESLRAGGGPLVIERVIKALPVKGGDGSASIGSRRVLATLACDLLEGKPTSDLEIPADQRLSFLNGWLRFVTATSPLARIRWAALAASEWEPLNDRDAYLLQLWKRIVGGEGGRPADPWRLIDYTERNWGPWSYYERHVFGWFLSRFNFSAARQMFRGSRAAAGFNAVVLAGALGVAALALYRGPSLARSLLLAIMAAALLLGSFRWLGLELYAHFNSLIPRLAATVGIGYLFLMSASQLLGQIQLASPPNRVWFGSGLLLATAYFYIAVHIWRRVHPVLRWSALLRRSLDVWLLAVSYAALGLTLAAPILFGSTAKGALAPEARPEQLALCAAIALNLGVVLQLVWDEKPLTEPL